MEITTTLSKAQADALFDREAVLFGSHDGVPEYRITELFGEIIGAWAEGCIGSDCYLHPSADFNGWGACSAEKPMINYFYRAGFHKIVSEHNYLVSLQRHRSSEAGQFVDGLWKARSERLAAQYAEDARKAQERREKRAAARKAKQEAAEQAATQ